MDTHMYQGFVLDCPRDAFTSVEDGRSYALFLQSGITIHIIGMDVDKLTVLPFHNAVRLYCKRYGNTVIGRIVLTVKGDTEKMWDNLNNMVFRIPKPVVVKPARLSNPAVSYETYQELMTAIEVIEATDLGGSSDSEFAAAFND